jgi:hypothetical protein
LRRAYLCESVSENSPPDMNYYPEFFMLNSLC